MTIREFAKLNNFPIKGKLTRIPDEVEYDFNDRPHNCKRYVDEDFNEYGIHEEYLRQSRKSELFKSLWLPIIVSLVTTLTVNALQWLWPLLSRWFSNSLV